MLPVTGKLFLQFDAALFRAAGLWGNRVPFVDYSVPVQPNQELRLHTSNEFVRLHQGCSLLLILFVIVKDRISTHCRGEKGVWFENLRVTSLLFVNDVALLASSSHVLQHLLDRFLQ